MRGEWHPRISIERNNFGNRDRYHVRIETGVVIPDDNGSLSDDVDVLVAEIHRLAEAAARLNGWTP